MSDKKITKEFHQKTGAGIENVEVCYFGTDGELVDMLSGFNLEEQLKLDLPSDIKIEDKIIGGLPYTVITQKYINNINDNIIYTLVTTLRTTSDKISIIKTLYAGEEPDSSAKIKSKSAIYTL